MRGKFSALLLFLQVVFIILYAFFVEYTPSVQKPVNASLVEHDNIDDLYPMYQDVHVMIFIGFGFLMTFLRRYGFGSVGLNMLLSAFVIEWAILMRGCLELTGDKVQVSLESLLNADFACGAVLISFGAVLGVLSPLQLMVMALLEVVVYAVNEYVIIGKLGITDIGGSMVIHAFGAYFGLGVSVFHWRKELAKAHPKEESVYHSDIFAMIGTLFLWMYWPSFNGAPAAGTFLGARAAINTVYSLAAAAVASFALSSILDKSGKLSMVHIQNATLAGGVAAGSVANLRLSPVGAILVGTSAGILSVVGYAFITPFMLKTFRLHDTCGVHNLHGMPGVLSAFVSVILARLSTPTIYAGNGELASIFSRATDSPDFFQQQANMQMAGLAVTLGLSIGGGMLTGLLLKIPFLDPVSRDNLFEDFPYWKIDSDEPVNVEEPMNGKNMMVMEEMPKKSKEAAAEEKASLKEQSLDSSPPEQEVVA
uniref:Rh type A glycoprotein n=1 Tax=Phallusia mammillata TaxID=59560 RepID=A0A6F9DQ33_9ASCI|nr:rh type A glycoprotein [Phallusia mammillata]